MTVCLLEPCNDDTTAPTTSIVGNTDSLSRVCLLIAALAQSLWTPSPKRTYKHQSTELFSSSATTEQVNNWTSEQHAAWAAKLKLPPRAVCGWRNPHLAGKHAYFATPSTDIPWTETNCCSRCPPVIEPRTTAESPSRRKSHRSCEYLQTHWQHHTITLQA